MKRERFLHSAENSIPVLHRNDLWPVTQISFFTCSSCPISGYFQDCCLVCKCVHDNVSAYLQKLRVPVENVWRHLSSVSTECKQQDWDQSDGWVSPYTGSDVEQSIICCAWQVPVTEHVQEVKEVSAWRWRKAINCSFGTSVYNYYTGADARI